ncbi:MAG TPA: hypothetical protein VKI45_07240 [Allosphingosinicella sp.]|nr:hypothetical protein [Allosphingosinicella sp.]
MAETSGSLRVLAARCRRLARGAAGTDVSRTLTGMADDYERQAEACAAREGGEAETRPPHAPPPAPAG